MKKIIAILAMVALVGGVAFAETSFGASAIGSVFLLKSDTSDETDGKITGSGHMNQLRVFANGSNEEGTFGGMVRIDGADPALWGNAWWKPIDQFLLRIGGNGGDGFFAKDGVTRWMFYQTVSDTDVVTVGNAWGGGYSFWPNVAGGAFYGGFNGVDNLGGLMLEIKPVEVFGLNIGLPYLGQDAEVADIFEAVLIQADINLDFGNIAITFDGSGDGKIYAYFGIGAIENVALDIGLGYGFGEGEPIHIGVGAKIGISETFGLKARVVAAVAGDDKATKLFADVLPFISLSDSMTVFISVGLAMDMPDGGDTVVAFHFNPYLQVGSEWGPKFLAGIKVSSAGGDDAPISWSVPIALNVGF